MQGENYKRCDVNQGRVDNTPQAPREEGSQIDGTAFKESSKE